MPGPFPGMDPFLEQPSLWPGVHDAFITYAAAELNRGLPEQYVARIQDRLVVEPIDRPIVPDLAIQQPPSPPTVVREAAVAYAQPDSAMYFDSPLWDSPRESFLEIRAPGDGDRVIAVVELLSHSNKDGRGRDSYLGKQAELMESDVHLIEIDLLRAGRHTVAIPLEALRSHPQSTGEWHYLASLHRAFPRPQFQVWARTVRDRLPRIAIPLDPAVPDTTLDIQSVLDRTYDDGAYKRLIRYATDPVPPLSRDDSTWMLTMLRQKGIIPARAAMRIRTP